ncbi:UPF0175 family protein [Anaerolineales bacterium HSG25]|nr:UPF0175 family protein [Anaerolineales bacterium HSG25]
MTTLTLTFTEELCDALRIPTQEQETRLQQELAIRLYEKNLLSLGKARQLAGLTKWEFLSLLTRENIVRHYDHDELQYDLETLEQLA